MRKILLLLLLIPQAAVAATVVTDPGAYGYLTGIDEKEQEQLEFLQSLENYTISIDNNLSGNKQIGYGINNNLMLYDDYLTLTLPANKSDKPSTISKNLELIYPTVKVAKTKDFEKRKYQQSSLRATLLFSEMIINSSKQKVSQLTSLASDIDGTNKLKEAMDVNSRLLLEILAELRNTNLLLAQVTKSQAARDYSGIVEIDYDEKNKSEDLLKGEGSLGSSISNTSGKGGKFTKITK